MPESINQLFGIGTSMDGRIVVSITIDGGARTVHTQMTPDVARIYAATIMALADQIAPPTAASGEGAEK